MTEASSSSSELEHKLGTLMKKHEDLGVKLNGLERDPLVDHLQIQKLKKQKLHLKDTISSVQRQLHS
ncbi:MAG: hypothetical protein ACI8P9_003915 [Parasphingorhabdus sp.]|jgi:hypothetical protein